ncbi:putative membrane protein [Pseudomonas amygdali pv. morsprunorum]|uniref:Membrane protein n=1 Tax=Pseudomonas syringae TaxID=317 RepID=A0A2K4X256_PSESX|nr:putative membrane protein [Pseudomonas amygdali pv. morsprunorum]RMO97935.1 putative membrane protein [Pseudomonas amygdali pv. morsprunorum]RMU28100.1 putative membrane protein [Pseudomonas amygdali pv. morsprunorum]SOS42188.1 membrane protein [Pseudomonas syringae]SPD79888.1 membrane protein [Pseudomonas syringae]
MTHFVGIPLIVLAVAVLLSRPGWTVSGVWVSPAALLALGSTIFYLRLDRPLGVVMAVLLALCIWAGANLAQQKTMVWLSAGAGLFVIGWIIQFIGHYYEGRKPAFIDDVTGLIIGPLFVIAELAFLMGLRKPLQYAIEERSGPVGRNTRKAAM